MNMISKLRAEIKRNGDTIIDTERFNQLQAEWIKRANPGFPALEQLRDLIVRDITEGDVSAEVEEAVNVAYDYIYESITRTLLLGT